MLLKIIYNHDKAVTNANWSFASVARVSLKSLCVINESKLVTSPVSSELSGCSVSCLHQDDSKVFYLETCQRKISVFACHSVRLCGLAGKNIQFYSGEDAYLFLLRVTTGLESQVIGETDIFGQFKQAWFKFLEAKNVFKSDDKNFQLLNLWMTRLLEDTKEIRTRFIQNVGGSSYGSLLRKLLRQKLNTDEPFLLGPTLLIGAGKLAQSVAPWLLEGELWIYNRNPLRLNELLKDLEQRQVKTNSFAKIKVLKSEEEELSAWSEAKNILLAVPPHSTRDSERIKEFQKGFNRDRTIVHLGLLRGECGSWNEVENFHPLDDLFEIQRSQEEGRQERFFRAYRACAEKAKLRSLSISSSIPHGWEDLSMFQFG